MNPRDHLESKDLLFPSLVSIERVEKIQVIWKSVVGESMHSTVVQ